MLIVLSSCNSLTPQEKQLFDAVQTGNLQVTEDLLNQGTSIEASTTFSSFLEFRAASEKGTQAKTNLSRRSGSTPLCWAAIWGQTEVARLLISRGAKVNAHNHKLSTPLMLAAITGREDLMRLLIKNGAKVDLRDGSGDTALAYAARYNQCKAMEILYQAGANVHTRDYKKYTPLMFAAQRDHVEAAAWLIYRGVNIHAVDYEGFNAMDSSRDHGGPKVRGLLASRGARNSPTKYRDAFGNIRSTPVSSGGSSSSSGRTRCTTCHGTKVYHHSDNSYHICSGCGGTGFNRY